MPFRTIYWLCSLVFFGGLILLAIPVGRGLWESLQRLPPLSSLTRTDVLTLGVFGMWVVACAIWLFGRDRYLEQKDDHDCDTGDTN